MNLRQVILERIIDARYFTVACFVAFVLIRILLLTVPVEPSSDMAWYFARAVTMEQGGGFSENGVPTAFWPIGYPAFLAGLFVIFGPLVLVGQIANLVLSAASFWLLYLIVRQMFASERVARISGALLAIYPNNAAFVALLSTETLFTFLLLLATRALFNRRDLLGLVYVGVIFGLATLVKTQTVLLIWPLVVLAGWRTWGWRLFLDGVAKSCVVVLVALLTIAPWSIRNHTVLGEFILVSTNGGVSLLCGNNPSVVGNYRSDFSCDDPLFADVRFSVTDQVAANQRAREIALQWIRENSAAFIGMIPKKMFRLWAPDGEAEWAYQAASPWYADHSARFRLVRYANQALYVLILGAALWAAVNVVRRRLSPAAYYGLAIVVVVSAISAVFSGQSRYHFPAMPFLIAYAAWVIADMPTGGLFSRNPTEAYRARPTEP